MSAVESGFEGASGPVLLTVEEACRVLRVGRSNGYGMARRYLATGGVEGLPVIRIGSLLRVPRWALMELIDTGTVPQLRPGHVRSDIESSSR